MELINNRYKIIKKLDQNRMYSNYLVSDMWNENQKMQLIILNSEFIPNSLIDFYSNEFIGLINLDSKNIVKNYYFNRVSYIDNKENTEEQYFYTCEYIGEYISLLEYIDNMNFSQIMDTFIEICKAIHYIHLNGYVYEDLNLDNIFIAKNNGNYGLKLKDLATVRLEKTGMLSREKPDRRSDIYSLATLLSTMIRKQYCELDKLLPIIKKATTFDEEYPYEYVYDMVEDINNSLDKNYKIVDTEELEKLNFHTKLIGREDEINYIVKSYDSMVAYKPSNRIFLVRGNTGTGKTRFLEEIKFLLELKNANIYSSFSLSNANDSNKKLWTEILRKLIFEADTHVIQKYQSELVNFFPEITDRKSIDLAEYINENITKYRLMNRIAGFINDSIKNKPAVFIIDDIHFADEFTINIFTYIYKEIINNENIILIFSHREGEALDNSRFQEFIDDIRRRRDSSTIYIDNLDEEQSGQLIKNMMSMSYVPTKLSDRIYSQSYGNPLFITEVMKELFNSKMIFIDDERGWWYIDVPDTNEDISYYEYLHIPNTIEQAVLNQLESLDSISLDILKTISIFIKPISIEKLSKFIDMDIDELRSKVQALVNKGILTRKIEDRGYVYDIDNNILKDIVYEKISSQEKIEKHRIAAEILEKEKDINNNFDELILHLEKANLKEKAKKYCIKNARRMRALKNIKAEIENLKKALSMAGDKNLVEKTELLIKIGSLYYETGNIHLATNFFDEAEKLAKISNNYKHLMDVYVYMAQIMDIQSNHKETIKYLDKAEKLLDDFEYLEARLEIKRIRAILLMDKNLFDKSAKLCLEIIEECGENLNKIKGNTCRLLAYIYSYENKLEESILLYEKSIKLFETINYSRGILIALNNIGCIYNDYYQDSEKALGYFKQVKDLSEEYGLFSNEILGLINIAVIYYSKYDYVPAYEHFKLALEKASKANFRNEVFFLYNNLAMLSIDMNNYQEAFYYYKLAKREFENSTNQGTDIVEFYNTSAQLYNAYGDFEKANEFFIKTIDFYKDGNVINKFDNIINFNINELRFKEIGSYDSNIEEIISTSKKFKIDEYKISSLIDTAIVLAKKNDYKNARKLILEAEKYMMKPIHDEVQASYYYSKGIIETGEDSSKLLLKSLGLAKRVKNKRIMAKANIELGNNYFSCGNYYYAANYYIEACEILRNFINQIPDEYKLTYINSYGLAEPFYRIKYIKSILIDGHDDEQYGYFKDTFKVNSYRELDQLINTDETNAFIENKEFMDFIIKQYMQISDENILTDKDILINLSGNTIKDIQLIKRYLAAFTLATKGLVIIEGHNQDLPSNTRVFDRVRVTMKPLLISNNSNTDEGDISFLPEGIRACLCMPIMSKHSSSRYDIIGYLYLESDRILNNFNHEGLQKCMEFSKLLSLLLEKHRLKFAASIDKLTGALTRKYLEDSLYDTLDRANSDGKTFSIIMYDLDRFKKVNDRFGHQMGDEVLREISKIVMDNIDKDATLGRYGGEEFIIILPGVGTEEALSTADKLREKIEARNMLGDKLDVTISMGVVSYPEHGQTIDELIEKVDKALYVAKESGRNMCQCWSNEFMDMAKPTNTINGILTGNEVRDSRNVLALVELIELVNKNIDREEKIYNFLGRIIEIIEAEFGILILLEKNKIKKSFGRKTQQEGWIDSLTFNSTIVKSVVQDRLGTYTIDWDSVEKHDLITGLPDWHSILAVPVVSHDEIKGVLYLSASTRIKEFGADDLNFANVLSNLLATII